MIVDDVLYHLPNWSGRDVPRRLSKVRAVVSPALWEGVNLLASNGQLWMHDLILARVPIPPYSSARQRQQVRALLAASRSIRSISQAESILTLRSADAALRKLRQGFGRGIRSENDHVRVWFLDPRLHGSDSWYASFLSELPEDFFVELDDALIPSTHPAIRDWTAAIPTRFRPELNRACMFIDGNLVLPKKHWRKAS